MIVTFAYVLGVLGALAEWRAYVQKQDIVLKRWSAIGAVLWSAMYGLLGASTAALLMFLTALRTSVSSYESPYRVWFFLTFVCCFIVVMVASWQGSISLLPAFAAINTTVALFFCSGIRLRLMLMLSSVAWISNDVLWHAWPALVAETVALFLNVRTLWFWESTIPNDQAICKKL